MASSAETLAAFEALLARAEKNAGAEDVMAPLLTEISTALSDIVGLMERPAAEPMNAAALTQAFREAMAEIKAPPVAVTVEAAQITVQPAAVREIPPAQVTVNPTISSPAGTKHRVDIERDRQGRATSFTVTKL